MIKAILKFLHSLQLRNVQRRIELDRREFSDLNAAVYKATGKGAPWQHDRMLFLQRRIRRNSDVVLLLQREFAAGLLPDYALYFGLLCLALFIVGLLAANSLLSS